MPRTTATPSSTRPRTDPLTVRTTGSPLSIPDPLGRKRPALGRYGKAMASGRGSATGVRLLRIWLRDGIEQHDGNLPRRGGHFVFGKARPVGRLLRIDRSPLVRAGDA